MSKKKFQFNPHTLSYEQIEHTIGYKVKRSILYFLSSLFSGIVIFFIMVTFFPSPRERQLIQEKKKILAQYNLLDKQLDELSLAVTRREEASNEA